MALLFDVITEVAVDQYQTKKTVRKQQTNIQETEIYSPNISPQYSMVHNPTLVFNSPSASVGTPTNITPDVVNAPSVIPTMTPTQTTELSDVADLGDIMGGGSGVTNILMLVAVIIGAVILIPMFLKRKKKKKIKLF